MIKIFNFFSFSFLPYIFIPFRRGFACSYFFTFPKCTK
nr:MAG TPA: hypothetical protein [Caudoviricetes sp.]